MKKYFMFAMIGIVSFLGINAVSADTYMASNFYEHFDDHIEAYHTYEDNINYLIDYWEKNHSSEYPYYFIFADLLEGDSSANIHARYTIYSTDSIDFLLRTGNLLNTGNSFNGNEYVATYQYDSKKNEYIYSDVLRSLQFSLKGSSYIIDSNISPTFKYEIYNYSHGGTPHTEDFNTIYLPSFYSDINSLYIPEIKIKDKGKIPTLKELYAGSYGNDLDNYIEIDLNKYPYVVLSLKDYTPRDTFTSTMFQKGQACATTVYNYGLEEKKDYISGYQTQPCGYYYNDFTPFTTYIRSEDITNHAVYYLTGYDSSKPNIVKVDTSVYDITYITSEEENEPYVTIEGKKYPVLPYDSLTDSATLTEKNGISNEWTCAKYDTDCLLNSSGINFSDLFSNPLEILKGLWYSITSIFTLISQFILLLPPVLQSFLFLSFMIAILLGIIKIIL